MQENEVADSAEVGAWEEARSRDSVVLLWAFAFLAGCAPRARTGAGCLCVCVFFFCVLRRPRTEIVLRAWLFSVWF